MGRGYGFTCKKCKKEYEVCLGIGMLFPEVYAETIKEIEEGTWGEEWKTILKSERFATPNVEQELYICEACGKWSVERIMDMYAPNDPEEILDDKCEGKTVRELGYVPYVMPWELKERYHIIKKWIHKCDCGKSRHEAYEEERYILPCPHCGTINEWDTYSNWD